MNYWIFQGSPDIYDIQGALRAGQSWKVAAYKEKISGDYSYFLLEINLNLQPI